MIVRIVTMEFESSDIPSFMALFTRYKSQIRNADGCMALSLIKNPKYPNQISTLSHWKSTHDLNLYRDSVLFGQVWPPTKSLFSSPPIATSYDLIWSDSYSIPLENKMI